MVSTPSIAFCDLVTDLLQQLLNTCKNTRLIICGTRTEFLIQLSAAIRTQSSEPNAETRHHLLTKTIGLLANSSKIQLAFCPSLESLRAYLAVFTSVHGAGMEAENLDRSQVLAILDLVALHATTTEFSAQGLSRTLATAVETASRAQMDLVLYPSSSDWGSGLWDTQVPLLNGSLRIRSEDGGWGGRGLPIKRVAERWFEFDQNDA
ncbi:unnamed protein product [Penicillium manginii]